MKITIVGEKALPMYQEDAVGNIVDSAEEEKDEIVNRTCG